MPGYYYRFFDPTYLLVLAGVLLSLAASAYLRAVYSRYSRIRSGSGMTGVQVAERILHSAGIYDVELERVSGELTDHYDPRNKVLRLSDSIYGSSSIAAVGVAAHECGHAIQHARGYFPLNLRSAIVPIANIGANLSLPVILLGIFLGYSQTLITIGIAMFSFAVLFQLITLPVEWNASARAARCLVDDGILSREEAAGTKKVLRAAAMTYVAAAAGAILQLLRLLILFGGKSREER